MFEFLAKLFDTSDFPARWNCGHWTTGHGLLHIVSDLSIAAAYAAIPIVLAYFAWRRRDDAFLPIFWLFAVFIFSCGFGHFVEATIFWHPWYRFLGLIKAFTAIVSWVTVVALLPVIPRALALPRLATVNRQLHDEVEERRTAEVRLQQAYSDLQEFANAVIEREERMIQLKDEVNLLLSELGRGPRYSVEHAP